MTGTLSVTVFPASYAESIPKRAEVILKGAGGASEFSFPAYYVSSRTVNDNNTCTFSCVDGMVKADTVINDDSLGYDDNGLVKLSEALLYIAGKCGFSEAVPIDGAYLTPYLSRDKIHGRSGREILEDLSKAWCGYWRIGMENNLLFQNPEISYATTNVNSYVAPLRCGLVEYRSVIMSDGSETYISGGGAEQCLNIDTDYASEEAAGAAYGRFDGYKYVMWKCTMCLLPGYVPVGTEFDFTGEHQPEGYYLCNNITIKPCASGIFGSVGRNTITEDEWAYKSEMDRRLDKKQSKGEKVTVFVNHNA